MARKRQRSKGVVLPWEARGHALRNLVAGSRSRTIVIATLVTLSAFLLVRGIRETRAERRTRLAIAEVQEAVEHFRIDIGRCPSSTHELVHPPRSRTRYLREMPRDGWGRALYVRCPGADDPDSVDVLSAGRDGSFFAIE